MEGEIVMCTIGEQGADLATRLIAQSLNDSAPWWRVPPHRPRAAYHAGPHPSLSKHNEYGSSGWFGLHRNAVATP